MTIVLYCVQVFLDEVNTSSCLGLFKEIILDRTFDGEVQTYNVHTVYDMHAFVSLTEYCSYRYV